MSGSYQSERPSSQIEHDSSRVKDQREQQQQTAIAGLIRRDKFQTNSTAQYQQKIQAEKRAQLLLLADLPERIRPTKRQHGNAPQNTTVAKRQATSRSHLALAGGLRAESTKPSSESLRSDVQQDNHGTPLSTSRQPAKREYDHLTGEYESVGMAVAEYLATRAQRKNLKPKDVNGAICQCMRRLMGCNGDTRFAAIIDLFEFIEGPQHYQEPIIAAFKKIQETLQLKLSAIARDADACVPNASRKITETMENHDPVVTQNKDDSRNINEKPLNENTVNLASQYQGPQEAGEDNFLSDEDNFDLLIEKMEAIHSSQHDNSPPAPRVNTNIQAVRMSYANEITKFK